MGWVSLSFKQDWKYLIKNPNFLKISDSYKTRFMRNSWQGTREELHLKCKIRIHRKTSELKVVCSVYLLHNSTHTDLASLCVLTRSLLQPVPLPCLQHSYLLARISYRCVGFDAVCGGLLSWYCSSLQSGKGVFSVYWGEIRPCSSLSWHSEFMECSWKCLKTVYIKLYMNHILSSPVWGTRRDVWLGNVLWIFTSPLNSKTLMY